ncbi:uncharacterized protein [Nicotiana sylvestris]|uniref:uncharacterized protein n=1 Tax=Nicotiana sylvestris TaxID=4096 RepID=UPI00388C61FB
MVKFEWDRQEVVLHGEDHTCAVSDAIVPFIETDDDKGPWVYQVIDTISVDKVPEGKSIPCPRVAAAPAIVVSEMLSNGFVLGKGLGAELQGIVQPVSLPKNLDTFGLGFKTIVVDVRRARKLKKKAWVLLKPIPCLSRSFVRPGVRKQLLAKVTGSLIGAEENLDKVFERVFAEVNMVEAGEGSSKANIQCIGPRAKVNNWEAIPLPIRRESCSCYADINDMTRMRKLWPNFKIQSNSEIIIQEIEYDDEVECDDNKAYEEISKELSHFEEKPKPNLNDTEAVNLRDQDNIRETKISVHLEPQIKEEIIKVLFEYKHVFAWSYDYMTGLSTDLVVHKRPTDPALPPVKQKLRKFKTNISVKIKEEITKQFDAKVIRVTQYPTWLDNVVPVPKKDGKTRVCVDYRDLNKASPKDNFPLPNILILIDNYVKHEIGSFVDCYVGYHQILMDEEDAEKTEFITLWGTYCYREIEVYVDDVIVKSRQQSDHVRDLRKCFQRLRMYNLKLNPAKCAFGVPSGKLLGFIVSRWGIELDPSKIKAIQELMPPRNKTEEAFDKIKGYLSNPPVLVPPKPGRPLILYLAVLDNSFGCVLGQHDVTSRKEQAIYYLSKKFTSYEALADHLAENPVDNDYEPLKTYFPDEEWFQSIEFKHIPRIHNEVADVFATLASMLHHPDKAYVDPLQIQVRDQHAYCNVVEEELDGEPWFHDIKEYVRIGEKGGVTSTSSSTSHLRSGTEGTVIAIAVKRSHLWKINVSISKQVIANAIKAEMEGLCIYDCFFSFCDIYDYYRSETGF